MRLRYLDGLRGLAAVIVVAHHLMLGFFPASYSRTLGDAHLPFGFERILHDTPLGIVINGGFAIGLFLLLSGYVASIQFQKSDSLKKFVPSTMIRFIRFFSLILSCNLIAYGLIISGQAWNHPTAEITQSWWWLGSMWQMIPSFKETLMQSVFSLVRTYSIQEVYNSSLWTMPLFFLGPLLVFGILKLAHQLRFRGMIYLLLIALLINTNYYLLVVGMAIHDLELAASWLFRSRFVRIMLVCMTFYFGAYPQAFNTALVTSLYSFLPIFSFADTSRLYLGLGALALFLLLLTSERLQLFFSSGFFGYLGERSFSLYISHILIINSVTCFLFLKFIVYFPYTVAFLVSLLISIPCFVMVSHLLYGFVEQKTKNLSYRMIQ